MSDEIERPYWVPTEYEAQYGDHIPQGLESAKRNLDYKSHYVLFVDILGFADLVQQDEESYIRWAASLSSLRASMRSPPQSPLQILFERFHRILESTLQEAKPWRPPAIVFSDSAFIAASHLPNSVDLSRSLMQRLISEEVPARMGLGFGGFNASRFSTETRQQHTHHISEFYGTAVVRAHQAESSGVPGMRILVHPSVETGLAKYATEATEPRRRGAPTFTLVPLEADAKCGVKHELNYLTRNAADDNLLDAVKRMQEKAPHSAARHYVETIAAVRAMRSQLES